MAAFLFQEQLRPERITSTSSAGDESTHPPPGCQVPAAQSAVTRFPSSEASSEQAPQQRFGLAVAPDSGSRSAEPPPCPASAVQEEEVVVVPLRPLPCSA